MNKKILIGIGILLVLPLISAASKIKYFEAFDLFHLFVESVFGNIFFSIIGLALLFFIIGAVSRMSQLSMFFLIGSFVGIMMMGYIGALVAVPIFLVAFYYFASSIYKALKEIA